MIFRNEKGGTVESFKGRNGDGRVIFFNESHYEQVTFDTLEEADDFAIQLARAIKAKLVEDA